MQKLFNEDCMETLRLNRLPEIDCVVTSPPYNIGLTYNQYKDNMEDDNYIEWLFTLFSHIKEIMKDDGSIFLNLDAYSKNPVLPFQIVTNLSQILKLQNTISWVKSIAIDEITKGHFKPINSKRFLNHTHEYIFHFTKTGDVPLDRKAIGVPFVDKHNIKRRNHSEDKRCKGDVWFIPYETVRSKEQKFNHPGIFPVDLPMQCLKLTGKTHGTVYDPFLGTGTTLVASEKLGWNGYGSEISEDYLKIASDRIRDSILTKLD